MKLTNFIVSFANSSTAAAAGLACLSLLSACSNQLQGVKISTSPELRRASIQVDVIGVSSTNRNAMENVPISKYFQAGNALRQNMQAKSMRFGNTQSNSQSLDKNDAVWKGWLDRKSQSIIIMADVPGVFDDLPGEADPRRKILPLSGKEAQQGVVHLEIFQGGLRQTSP